MPANLPPLYFEADRAYRRARAPEDKIEALETMLAVMPKHKGTEHLKAELRARLASVTHEVARQAGGAARAQLYSVAREGAAQVALIGLPNAGKSQLLAALTHATPKVADYPFTTQLPQPGMMDLDGVHVQLVDLPALTPGETPAWLRALLRQADLLLVLLDLSGDPLSDWLTIHDELAAAHVRPHAPLHAPPQAPGATTAAGDDWEAGVPKRTVLAGTKLDLPAAEEMLDLLRVELGRDFPLHGVSGVTGAGLVALKGAILGALDLIRVYTKPPGHPPERNAPFALPRGSTIDDLADAIHHDLREKLRYATVWGASGRFAGQRVGREHVLDDGDVVELHER